MARGTPGKSLWGSLIEILSLPLLIAIWQAAAMYANARLFPTPVEVFQEFWDLLLNGRLLSDLGKTLTRAAIAFVVAMAIGTLIGIVVGRTRLLDRLVSPWTVIGLNMPAIVIGMICYIGLGLNEFSLILAVVLNKTPLVITNVREGVRSFQRDYDELASAFRLSLPRRIWLIFIPQLMPFVLAAARTGLSLIWKIVLVFEVLGSDGGVGFRIYIFFGFFDITSILAYTFSFILVVLAFEYGVLRPLEKSVLKWRPARA